MNIIKKTKKTTNIKDGKKSGKGKGEKIIMNIGKTKI